MTPYEPDPFLSNGRPLTSKPLTANPIQVSPALGAVLALQGVYRAIPILHGAEGCAEAIKGLLMSHFREPIPLLNMVMNEYNHVFGSRESIREALELVVRQHKPDVIALVGTTLTDLLGEDLPGNLKEWRKQSPTSVRNRLLIAIHPTDEEGGLEQGYAQTVEALVEGLIELNGPVVRKKRRERVNLLPGPHLTPGDVIALKEMLAAFDLEVLTLPDLSTSLSGHLLMGHSSLTRGGTPLELMREMPASGFTIAIGDCMEKAAKRIQEAFHVPYRVFGGMTGLRATDELLAFLQEYSRSSAPLLNYRWQREFLLSGMLDALTLFRDLRVVAALEPDHARGMKEWMVEELGVASFHGLVPNGRAAFNERHAFQMGDLEDVDRLASAGADLWLGHSKGERLARSRRIPFHPMGFPVTTLLGYPLSTNVGYRGTLDLLHRIGNTLLRERDSTHP